jgi:hypothetical protein
MFGDDIQEYARWAAIDEKFMEYNGMTGIY